MASMLSALSLPSSSLYKPRRGRHVLFPSYSLKKLPSVCLYGGNSTSPANFKKLQDFRYDPYTRNNTALCLIEMEPISPSESVMETSDFYPKFVHNGMKLALLSGVLSLVGCHHASATTEIASGLQYASFLGDLDDIGTGFTSAFLLIFFSELGDKTFFIAALLAARNSGLTVFLGTFGALALMTIISVILGRSFHYVDGILPFRFGETDLPIDDIAAVFLLVYFGISTLIDASSSESSKSQEEKEEAEIAIADVAGNGVGIVAAANTVISTFALVFVAEWGDKSFFSTIALAAASSPLGVVGGALAGHAAATTLAVVGGSLLGTFFSEKAIAYVGGILFLVFAAVTLAEIVS